MLRQFLIRLGQVLTISIFCGCEVMLFAQLPSLEVLDYMPPSHRTIVERQVPNAQVLDGGIRFLVREAGEGNYIEKGDRVTALYIGRLLDGTIFNQKRSPSHTFKFYVGAEPRQIIKGWEIAMPLMRMGGKYTLAIPSEFAYRDKGREDQVPPYATVIFEIDILDVDRRSGS